VESANAAASRSSQSLPDWANDFCWQGGSAGAAASPGLVLEYMTLGWNVAGIAVLAIAAVAAGSVALAGVGLDS
jgi:hypothetical protein